MFYVVGLGNPGEKYTNTRHNVGFDALIYVTEQAGLPAFVSSAKLSGRVSDGVLSGADVSVLLPDTFMNNSGTAVRKLVPKGEEEKLVVVYDDVDLPIGDIKLSFGRGAGGHNGLTSVIAELGTKDFARIRIGVASKGLFGGVKRPKGERLAKHVLGRFSKKEAEELTVVFDRVSEALGVILTEGIDPAMTKFNQ